MTIQDNAVTASDSMPEAGFEDVMKAVALVFLVSQNEVFADILNAVLFNGRQVIQPSEVQDYSTPCHYLEREGLPDVRRDVVKIWDGVIIHVVCTGMEDHAEPDPDLPARLFGCLGEEYGFQLDSGTEEVLPVVTVALYFGEDKPWDAPLTLKECLTVSDRFSPYVNDFKALLFQIPYLSREQADLFKSDFRLVADYYVQKREGGCYHPDPAAFAEKPEMLPVMKAITKDKRFTDNGEGFSDGNESDVHSSEAGMILLTRKLLEQGRVEDVRRACEDKEFRAQIKKELGIS